MARVSKNFTTEEAERASQRALTPQEIERFRLHVLRVLQPARRVWGRIRVSSYVRTGASVGAGSHADGNGIDFVPMDAPMRPVFEWIATNLPGQFGELILEDDHIHMTLTGYRGEAGEVLEQVGTTESGNPIFDLASIAPVALFGTTGVIVFAVVAWFLLRGKK